MSKAVAFLVFLASAATARADASDFKACLRAKLFTAKGSCPGQTCTPGCKQAILVAIGTMDGSCCDVLGVANENQREQCVSVVTQQLVPMLQQRVEQMCGPGLGFAFDLDILAEIPQMSALVGSNGMAPSGFVFAEAPKQNPTFLTASDFKACLRAKLFTAKGSCPGQTCTPGCKQAILVAIGTMDGSCCDVLGVANENQREQCVSVVTQQLVPMLQQRVEQMCGPGLGFAFDLDILAEIPQMSALVGSNGTAPSGFVFAEAPKQNPAFLSIAVPAFFVGAALTAALAALLARRSRSADLTTYESMLG